MNPVSTSHHVSSAGTIELKIPPKDIKRLDDPHDDNRYAYECQLPVTEASKLLIGSANPRMQDLEKPLSQQILSALETTPEEFHLKNRGIWVAARRAEYDNQTQILRLECPQNTDQRYGVVDGGHTKALIDRFLVQLKENSVVSSTLKPMPYVMVHVRVGVEENLEDMVVCLNRSAQLKEYALDDYKGHFDQIKKIFKSQPFEDEIGYTENADRDYDILDVIQRLTLLCVGIYPNAKDVHPTGVYSSKAKCLQQFINQKEKYLALEPIMADCFRLPDQIEVLLPEIAGSGKFGRFTFAKKQKPRLRPSLKGVPTNGLTKDWNSPYRISDAIIYPLTASLRVLVRLKADGTVQGWRQDPAKFFKQHGRELWETARKQYNDEKSLTTLGRKTEFWAALHKAAYVALHPED